MAEWSRRASQDHEHECTVHDLEVMGLNASRVELGVYSTFVTGILDPKTYISVCLFVRRSV